MKITVLSKSNFDKTMQLLKLTDENVEQITDTFFISIHNSFKSVYPPHFKNNHDNVLLTYFDDVEEDGEYPALPPYENDERTVKVKALTEEQGQEILDFINKHKDKRQCIVHCAMGKSRSAAVGEFLNDYLGQDYLEFKRQNPQIDPNIHVRNVLKKLAEIY